MLSRWKTVDRIEAICKKHNVIIEQINNNVIKFTAPPDKVFRRFPWMETTKSFYWRETNLIGIIGWVKMWISLLEEKKK